ncbi:MAG: hypothetical protein WBQ94_13445 [Terracidiphilus sp.]
MVNDQAFAIILRAVDDPAFRLRLAADMSGVLSECEILEPESRDNVTRVVAVILRAEDSAYKAFQEQHDTTLQTADSFKSGLRDTVKQIERGFRSTMMMYTVAFYLGVGMILAAVAMAFVQQKSLLPIVFGGLGIADVIAYFITKPPQDLQFSRARLAQLQAAFFNWFIDYTNWNGVLMTWTQNGRADFQSLKAVSAILMEHT